MPVVPRNAVGGNIGGAWSNFEVTDVATGGTVSTSNSGFAGGGQISCHSHLSMSAFGGIADIDRSCRHVRF